MLSYGFQMMYDQMQSPGRFLNNLFSGIPTNNIIDRLNYYGVCPGMPEPRRFCIIPQFSSNITRLNARTEWFL